MKAVKTIAKILAVLAAIAGVVYIAATYGDKIVAWCKKLLASLPCCCGSEEVQIFDEAAEESSPAEDIVEVAAEETAEEAAEMPEDQPVAEDQDFEG